MKKEKKKKKSIWITILITHKRVFIILDKIKIVLQYWNMQDSRQT